jgi:hypothetical protein
MRRVIVATIFAVAALASVPALAVHIGGYFKSNGTYVAPYERSAPDNSYNNNWSVEPNVNPYTGKEGTREPTYNDRPPCPADSITCN